MMMVGTFPQSLVSRNLGTIHTPLTTNILASSAGALFRMTIQRLNGLLPKLCKCMDIPVVSVLGDEQINQEQQKIIKDI